MSSLLRMYRGDTHTFDVLVTDDQEVPIDITSMDLRFTAKYRYQDPDDDAVIVKTSSDGIANGVGTGEAIITIEPEDTETLEKTTRLVWDFQLTDVAGNVKTPTGGQLLISADISRAAP